MTIDLKNMPELIWELRREMAAIVRAEADADADPRVARRLRHVADVFEAGQGRG